MLENSPHIEAFKKKDIEVLFLIDPIDEWIVENLNQYEDAPLKSIAKVDAKTEDTKEEKSAQEKKEKEFSSLFELLQENLKEEVSEVKASKRLVDSPVCLVASESGMSSQMERMMKNMGQEMPTQKKIMEINLEHPLFKKMQTMYEKDSKNSELKDYSKLLLDQAKLAEGSPIKDMNFFLKKMAELMAK